jgi:hypothetical protein
MTKEEYNNFLEITEYCEQIQCVNHVLKGWVDKGRIDRPYCKKTSAIAKEVPLKKGFKFRTYEIVKDVLIYEVSYEEFEKMNYQVLELKKELVEENEKLESILDKYIK